MLEFELKNSASRARIWFKPEESFLLNHNVKYETLNFQCNQSKLFNDKTVILEINIYAGPRYFYGLLGVNYYFNNSNELTAKINSTNKNIIISNGTLIKSEVPYLGLPEEYKFAIHKGLDRAYREEKLLFSGVLDFCYAVHGLVASCSRIFQTLTYLLIDFLLLEEKELKREIFLEKLKIAYNYQT